MAEDGTAREEVWEWLPLLSEEYFEPLIGAAIYEPDPNFNRWFVEPASNAFGRRRV